MVEKKSETPIFGNPNVHMLSMEGELRPGKVFDPLTHRVERIIIVRTGRASHSALTQSEKPSEES